MEWSLGVGQLHIWMSAVPWGCEFGHHLGYHLILVDIPTQCEIPRARDFWYHLILVGIPSQTWGSSTGVGLLISSDPCVKSKSIWSFRGVEIVISSDSVDSPNQSEVPRGVGILTSSDPCGQPKSMWRNTPTGADTSSRAETRLWDFHFVNQRSLGSTGMISTYTHRESSWLTCCTHWQVSVGGRPKVGHIKGATDGVGYPTHAMVTRGHVHIFELCNVVALMQLSWQHFSHAGAKFNPYNLVLVPHREHVCSACRVLVTRGRRHLSSSVITAPKARRRAPMSQNMWLAKN